MEDSSSDKLLFTCSVCSDSFTDTSQILQHLDCSHSICTTCLKKLANGRNLTCPLCKVVHVLKHCDETYISSGSSERRLIDVFRKRCTQCDENKLAIKFCEECNEYICSECVNAHQRTKLTKNHKLSDIIHERGSEITFSQEYCTSAEHSNCVVNSYCMKCNEEICEKCAKEKHTNHNVKLLTEVVAEEYNELKSVIERIKQNRHQNMTEILEEKTARTKEIEEDIKIGLSRQFNEYKKVLEDRCNVLKSQVEEKATLYIENAKDILGNMQGKLTEADLLSNEKNAMTFIRSCRDMIKALRECERNISKFPEKFEFRFSQVCTTDDFEKVVKALGTIQDSSEPSHNSREEHAELHSQVLPAVPGESSAVTSQLMDVLKSLTVSEQSEKPLHELSFRTSKLNSTTESSSINNETFILRSVNPPNEVDVPKHASLKESNLRKGERNLLRLDSVKDMVNLRFETWGLSGNWRIEGDKVEMFSRSPEEADHCMKLLKETLLEKTIPLQKDSKFIVESDKWQIMIGMLKKKFQDQIQVDVIHDDCEVKIYSTSIFILKDSYDVIRIFLRDNQMKTFTLKYEEPVAVFVMKNKGRLQKICSSLSQYCIKISPADKTGICLRGIGFGVGRAIHMVNALACKFSNSTDEDRFESDGETDEDEEDRFQDDDNDEQAGARSKVAVQISLLIEDDMEAGVRAMCLPGDDRLLYVVAGNMIGLPVEALVNAADKTLKHNGGLAKALVLKGGRSIQEECTDYVQKNGNVEIGQVFCSGAGTLASSVIIHAVGPKWINGNHKETDKLYECVTNCLKNASKSHLASIAFPAISSGTYKFPIKDGTLTILKAVKDFLLQEPRCCIREMYFCDRDMDTANAFVTSLKATFHGEIIVLSEEQASSKSAEGVDSGRNKKPILFM